MDTFTRVVVQCVPALFFLSFLQRWQKTKAVAVRTAHWHHRCSEISPSLLNRRESYFLSVRGCKLRATGRVWGEVTDWLMWAEDGGSVRQSSPQTIPAGASTAGTEGNVPWQGIWQRGGRCGQRCKTASSQPVERNWHVKSEPSIWQIAGGASASDQESDSKWQTGPDGSRMSFLQRK